MPRTGTDVGALSGRREIHYERPRERHDDQHDRRGPEMQGTSPPRRAGGKEVQEVERGQYQERLQHLCVEAETDHGRAHEQPSQAYPLGGDDKGPHREHGQDHEHVRRVVAARGDDYRGDGQDQRGQEPRHRTEGTAHQVIDEGDRQYPGYRLG